MVGDITIGSVPFVTAEKEVVQLTTYTAWPGVEALQAMKKDGRNSLSIGPVLQQRFEYHGTSSYAKWNRHIGVCNGIVAKFDSSTDAHSRTKFLSYVEPYIDRMDSLCFAPIDDSDYREIPTEDHAAAHGIYSHGRRVGHKESVEERIESTKGDGGLWRELARSSQEKGLLVLYANGLNAERLPSHDLSKGVHRQAIYALAVAPDGKNPMVAPVRAFAMEPITYVGYTRQQNAKIWKKV